MWPAELLALLEIPKEALQAKGKLYLKEICLQEGMGSPNGKHVFIEEKTYVILLIYLKVIKPPITSVF